MTRERIDALGPADWRRGHAQYIEPLLSQNLGIVDALRSIAARHHCSPAEVAVAWVLLRPAVAGAIVGGRRPSQFDHIVKAAELKLSDDDLTELETSLNA
jgi:aryl-alcohol dehydrogenase-like predicted oxidoreductase